MLVIPRSKPDGIKSAPDLCSWVKLETEEKEEVPRECLEDALEKLHEAQPC